MVSSVLAASLSLFVVMVTVAPARAQYRPSYFPRPGGFDQVLPQYGGAGAGAGAGAGGDAELGNRDNAPPALPAPGMTNSLEDTQLANRVPEWPRPHQPFWFLNQQAIAQHTAQQVPCRGSGCPPLGPAPQSSFIGSAQRG